jgi:hypothetical protein
MPKLYHHKSLKLKEEVGINLTLDPLMDGDPNFAFESLLSTFNIKKEVCGVFDLFLSFLKKYKEIKIHNMFLLMLDPQSKNHC